MEMMGTPPARVWATVGRAVGIYRERAALFLGLTVAGGSVRFILDTLTARADTTGGAVPAVVAMILGLAGMTASVWVTLAMYAAADRAVRREPIRLGESLRMVRGKFWAFVGLSIVFVVLVFAGLLLFLIPGVYWSVACGLYGVVVMLEGQPGTFTAPLRRSHALVETAFVRSFLVSLAAGLFFVPALLLTLLATTGQVVTNFWLYEIGLVLGVLATPVYVITVVVWYHALIGRHGAAPIAAASPGPAPIPS